MTTYTNDEITSMLEAMTIESGDMVTLSWRIMFVNNAPAIVAQQQDRIEAFEKVLDLIATGAYPRDGAMMAAKNVLAHKALEGGDA